MRHTIWFLKNLRQLHFSGQLVPVEPAGQQWTFYLSQGSIVYATGGIHPVRRWRRNVAIHCPWLSDRDIASDVELDRINADLLTIGWEYALLKLWVAQQKITRDQAVRVIQGIVVEVLFDVSLAVDLTDQVNQDSSLSTFAHLGLVEVEGAIAQAERLQRNWQDAKLSDYSPNKAPVIKQREQLRKLSSARFYDNLVELLDGQRTLRDLSVKMQRDEAAIATSLLPFVQMGWVGFISIADLPAPVWQKQPPPALAPAIPDPIEEPVASPLIACIDDSFWVCNMMEKIIASAGYQFVGVNDPLRAINVLLSRKPDLIFLDLVMPTANGYEICEKLRKISCFRDTPIVILTGNDGFVSRLRSSSAGATDFLTKPLEAEAVLGAVRKHLNQGIANNHAPTNRGASRDSVSGSASSDSNTARFSVATDH